MAQEQKANAKSKSDPVITLRGEIGKLEAERKPYLERREANRAKGKKMSKKIEEECNSELRDRNTRIKELKDQLEIME